MKKIITSLIILALVLVLFTFPAFAEDVTTDETSTESAEITVESEEKAFYDELIDALTNGANWAKFGGILAAVLAVLGVLYKYTSGIKNLIYGVKALVEGKATKEETKTVVKEECEKIRASALAAIEETKKKQDELTDKYNEQTAILTLITLQLVKNPHARTEIIALISSAKAKGKDAAEIVEAIEAEIKAAEAAEEKVPTPALDAIVASVNGDTEGGSGVALG